MDDLIGLDWDSSKKPTSTSAIPPLRPSQTPSGSGTSTPSILRPSSTANSQPSLKIGSRIGTPANDSFASLLGGNAKQGSSLSLQERQRQLQEEKAKKEAEERKRLASQYGSAAGTFWNGPGGQNGQKSGISSLPPVVSSQKPTVRQKNDDILAAFNSSAPVDSSSHFPPPSARKSPFTSSPPIRQTSNQLSLGDDDDPFGLGTMPSKPTQSQRQDVPAASDDDDILGMLGRPVEEVKSLSNSHSPEREHKEENDAAELSTEDKAVAELVDMGFSPDQAAIALARTESGYDVQAAVGIILNEAHSKAKSKSQSRGDTPEPAPRRQDSSNDRDRRREKEDSVPPWMKNQEESSRSSSTSRDQSSSAEKDVAKLASEIGSSIFKSANSLWKTGQKKVQRAVADLQQDGDSNQPKWMRDAQLAEKTPPERELPRNKAARESSTTVEAAILESRDGTSTSERQRLARAAQQARTSELPSRPSNPVDRRNTPSPASSTSSRPANRLTRQELESESAEAYISPARRRKQQPSPQTSLIEPTHPTQSGRAKSPLASPPLQSNNPFSSITSKPPARSTSSTPRPRAPRRQIPPASSAAISTSASHRQKGTEAYKRGDFSSAHASYSSALQSIPSNHPVAIVVLCNRALTNIKVGEPKAAIIDANTALEIIGISQGEGEKINLGQGEGEKDMKEFYGKALMRKAEALENMEKWSDAAKIWRQAVEAGVGGAISIQGRNRCEKAAGGGNAQPVARPKPKPKPAPKPKVSALDDLAGRPRPGVSHAGSAEAVRKLRQANAAADKADDEKFALMDHVDAKLIAWKGTKADNLRALLGSLDKVLWETAGWNKVGMQDLVMANRVKIIYMKAIAKVHPDKVSPTIRCYDMRLMNIRFHRMLLPSNV